jgi:hypothetical protein
MVLAQKQTKNQQSKIEKPEINPYSSSHFIFDKESKNIHWRKGSLFNKLCRENWLPTCRKQKLEHSLYT